MNKPLMHSEIESILERFDIPFHYVLDHIIVKPLGDVTYWTKDKLMDRIT